MQEENLSHVSKGDVVAGIHKMEVGLCSCGVILSADTTLCVLQLDRVKYVLCSYLRVRLKKVLPSSVSMQAFLAPTACRLKSTWCTSWSWRPRRLPKAPRLSSPPKSWPMPRSTQIVSTLTSVLSSSDTCLPTAKNWTGRNLVRCGKKHRFCGWVKWAWL